jgi:hypothetical protein
VIAASVTPYTTEHVLGAPPLFAVSSVRSELRYLTFHCTHFYWSWTLLRTRHRLHHGILPWTLSWPLPHSVTHPSSLPVCIYDRNHNTLLRLLSGLCYKFFHASIVIVVTFAIAVVVFHPSGSGFGAYRIVSCNAFVRRPRASLSGFILVAFRSGSGRMEVWASSISNVFARVSSLYHTDAVGLSSERSSCIWSYNSDIRSPLFLSTFRTVNARNQVSSFSWPFYL